MALHVNDGNDSAAALYASSGYRALPRHRRWWSTLVPPPPPPPPQFTNNVKPVIRRFMPICLGIGAGAALVSALRFGVGPAEHLCTSSQHGQRHFAPGLGDACNLLSRTANCQLLIVDFAGRNRQQDSHAEAAAVGKQAYRCAKSC